MLASLLWAVGPVHFDEAKVPKQVHMWYDKPNGFFTTTDYFNTCAALRNSPLAATTATSPTRTRSRTQVPALHHRPGVGVCDLERGLVRGRDRHPDAAQHDEV